MPKVEDNKDYTNRIEIKSSSSKRIYIMAQHNLKDGGLVAVLDGFLEENVSI